MPNRNAKQKLLALMMCVPLLTGCTSGKVTAEVNSCGDGESNGAEVTITNNTSEPLVAVVMVGWFDSDGTQLKSESVAKFVSEGEVALGETKLGPETTYESCKITEVLVT